MVVRSDIIVNFDTSPRIITVLSPSANLTIQDLHDTVRTIEAYPWNMSYKKLISSAGKEDLGSGVKVGITTTLQDSQIEFEGRAGPSYILCIISGGNLVAIDSIGNSITPIFPSSFTQVVLAQSSSATIIQGTSEWTQSEKDTHITATQNIPNDVWSLTLSGISTVGSIGKRIIDVLKLKRTKP